MKENLLHPPNTFWIIVTDDSLELLTDGNLANQLMDECLDNGENMFLYKSTYTYKKGFKIKYIKGVVDCELC